MCLLYDVQRVVERHPHLVPAMGCRNVCVILYFPPSNIWLPLLIALIWLALGMYSFWWGVKDIEELNATVEIKWAQIRTNNRTTAGIFFVLLSIILFLIAGRY